MFWRALWQACINSRKDHTPVSVFTWPELAEIHTILNNTVLKSASIWLKISPTISKSTTLLERKYWVHGLSCTLSAKVVNKVFKTVLNQSRVVPHMLLLKLHFDVMPWVQHRHSDWSMNGLMSLEPEDLLFSLLKPALAWSYKPAYMGSHSKLYIRRA